MDGLAGASRSLSLRSNSNISFSVPIKFLASLGTGFVQHKVEELKSLCKDMMPTSKPVRHTTLHHDDRRTVEILHRNQIEKVDHDRRVQYDNLVHDFVVSPQLLMFCLLL